MVNRINKNTKVKYIKNDKFVKVEENSRQDLNKLKQDTKDYLKSIKYPLINNSTGYIAKINSRSVGKMLFPAPYFNPFTKNYIDNLNALLKIKELF